MSVEIIVRFPVARTPDVKSWQEAIIKHRFPLDLDKGFDPRLHTGYLPVKLNGGDSGFEYFYESMNQQAEVNFVTRSDTDELLSAVTAAAVLTALTGGILEETQEGETFSGDEAVEWARQIAMDIAV